MPSLPVRVCDTCYRPYALSLQRQLGSARPQTAIRARQRPQRKLRQSEPAQPEADLLSSDNDGFSAEFALDSTARLQDVQPSAAASPAPHLRTGGVHPQTLSASSLSLSSSSSAGALSALTAELVECSQVDEILEVVSEEAELLTGEAAVLALRRLAQCPRDQHMQLRVSEPFAQLLALLERLAPTLGPKEVAQALWSLAKLRQNRPKLVTRLCTQARDIVGEFNERDISTVAWALGSMQSKADPALLQELSSAAVSLWADMQPQGISMLMLGLAKLDASPGEELLRLAADSLRNNLQGCDHQAVANTFYSLARLQHYDEQLCVAVELHVSQNMSTFRPQELMNTLWAFVQFRYQPGQLLARLDETVQQPEQAARFSGSDWAALVWGFACLGAAVTGPTAAAISQHGASCLETMKPADLCNLLWGLGVMDLCEQPIFAAAFKTALQRHSLRSLEPRLMRQLLQAAVLADAAGVEVSLPDQVRRTAAKWWSATRNMVPSLSHTSISKQLRQRGVPHSMMVHIREGLPTIDIAIQPKTGSRPAALQVLGPHEISVNTQELLGRTKAEARLLEAHGWTPMHILVGVPSRPVGQQVHQIARIFGDTSSNPSNSRGAPGGSRGAQQGSRGRGQAPPADRSRRSDLQEKGWVDYWQQPQTRGASQQEPHGEARSMGGAQQTHSALPSNGIQAVGQRQQMPQSGSARSHLAYPGFSHGSMASLVEAAHR